MYKPFGAASSFNPRTFGKRGLAARVWQYRELYLILLLPLSIFIMFNYIPMYYVKWAFTNYGETIAANVKFIGLDNFIRLFNNSDFIRALQNTLMISFYSLAWGFPVPIMLALLLDEVVFPWYKKTIQTIVFFPHFLSIVVIASIWYMVLAPQDSINAQIAGLLGVEPTYFFAESRYIRTLLVGIGIWQGAGYSAIIYIAALSNVDVSMFEAARIDGASRIKQAIYIKLPAIKPTIIIMLILSLSQILNVFDNVIVIATPVVFDKADVIMTLAYRTGIQDMKLGYGMAVSLFKAVFSLILVLGSNRLARAIGENGII